MLDNKVCQAMIRDSNTEYETPGIKEIEGEMWKGKADIINHNEKLVIDLKTTKYGNRHIHYRVRFHSSVLRSASSLEEKNFFLFEDFFTNLFCIYGC